MLPRGMALWDVLFNKLVDATTDNEPGMFSGFTKAIKKFLGL